jgi:tRNA nucleotidyltransferase/poly(A) polymerase
MKFPTFEVGGCIRDELKGIPSKDVDFAVEAPSFEAMRDELVEDGFEIFEERPDFFTIRAKVPKGHPLELRTRVADFVMCRKDGPSTDGRRPDFVEAGTIFDDLARRDFTVNAIARNAETGEFIDPHNGLWDLGSGMLKFVGKPEDRIREDGLRVLRGFRFKITKGFFFEAHTATALSSPLAVEMLASVSTERIVDEITKMFSHDTRAALVTLTQIMPTDMLDVILDTGIRLKPSLKEKW